MHRGASFPPPPPLEEFEDLECPSHPPLPRLTLNAAFTTPSSPPPPSPSSTLLIPVPENAVVAGGSGGGGGRGGGGNGVGGGNGGTKQVRFPAVGVRAVPRKGVVRARPGKKQRGGSERGGGCSHYSRRRTNPDHRPERRRCSEVAVLPVQQCEDWRSGSPQLRLT